MKLRIYLDTSVFSALYDDRISDRQLETREFWGKANSFEISTSEVAEIEISQTPNPELKIKMLKLLENVRMISVTQEMQNLTQDYIDAHIFTPIMRNDALHVAAAVMTRQDV